MKQLLLLLLFSLLFVYARAQDTVPLKNPTVFTIGGEAGHLYCLQQNMEMEVAEWAYDSCNFYQNRFNVYFEVHNASTEKLILRTYYIIWYDASGDIRPSGSNIHVLEPGKTTTIKIEVIPYHRWKMNSWGQFSVNTDQGELLIPMRLKTQCTSKKCCCPKE